MKGDFFGGALLQGVVAWLESRLCLAVGLLSECKQAVPAVTIFAASGILGRAEEEQRQARHGTVQRTLPWSNNAGPQQTLKTIALGR